MPLEQLHVVKKIKYLVSNAFITKKQIVNEVNKNARDHLLVNQRQEKDDKDRIEHAVKELKQENNGKTNFRIINLLTISIAINIIFLVIFMIIWYLVNSKN